MNKQAYLKGVVIPIFIVLSAAVLSGMGYFGLRGVQISVLRPPIIMILGTTYFLAIVFGVGAVFTIILAAPILTILVGLALTVGIFTWGHGENSYVMFLAGFRKIFGSGI